MKQYIERQAAIELCGNAQGKAGSKAELAGISKIWHGLKRLPTADVVQVVRCGECIHRVNMEHSMDNKEICCGRMAMRVMALDDYCSHGVRIDGGENHG